MSIDIGGSTMIERWQKVYLRDISDPNIYTDPEFKIAVQFGVSFTPATVVFDKGAFIKRVISGYNPEDHDALEKALK